jgi:hypothetical protein
MLTNGKEMSRPMKYTGTRLDEYLTAKALLRLVFTKADLQRIVVDLNRREKRSRAMIAKAEQKRKTQEVEAIRVRAQRQVDAQRNVLINQYETLIRTNLNNHIDSRFQLEEVNREIGLSNLIDILNRINRKLILRIGRTYYVLSETTRQRLLDAIANQYVFIEGGGGEESDAEFVASFYALIGDIVISEFNETNNYQRANGAFFPYTHNTVFDLKRYGIFQTDSKQDYDDTCLIVALRNGGLEDASIERIKLIVKNRIIPQTKLNEVCDVAKIQIKLKKDNDAHPHVIYGKKYERVFEIGLLCDHYFLVEKTKITSYCVNNYEQVKEEKDFNKIYKFDKYYKRSEDRYIDSFDVVKLLLINKDTLLTEITMEDRLIASTQFYRNVKQEIVSLAFDDSCFKPVVEEKEEDEEEGDNKKKREIKFENVVFDFETDPNGTHKPYLVRTYNDKMNNVFYGEDCGLKMLRSLRKNTRLIAHNATYDYRFLIEYLWNIEELARGNRLISLKARFGTGDKYINIEIKDSYHLISMPLRAFPKVFNLESEKEIMPYKLYTQENITKRFINIQYVLDNFIDEADKAHFLTNIMKWKLQQDDDYDIIEYSSRYCELDCKILYQGYNIFRRWMLECTNINIDNKLTIASLAHQYFIDKGCYDGVYKLGGIPQLFIQGCVVGGRTMTANNEKIAIEERINDFDAVSLYPSAMARMPGFLKGKPKIVENLSYDWLKTQDGYFVDIIINSVGIKRAFPLMSFKNEEGVRMFSNDMIGKTIRVDKTTLEDLIQFQQITFTVVRGYYFSSGFNTKVCETIKFLFEERLKKKKEKNPVEMIYKLIMNSSYGKSIMKPIETETRFFDDEKDFNVYLSRNYNWATSYVKFGSKTKLNSVKVLDEHFNIAQVGVCILSMSKRIMNEVMCLAEDNSLDIYYQDTDSMHLKDADIPKLSELFKAKYDTELIGKNMGQFHSDFDLKGCDNIIAVRSIFLGKKSYIDELQGINKNGEIETGYHIRMKGIPNKCLLFSCKQNNFKNPFELYQSLYSGNKLQIDLTNNGEKANFKYNKDYSCETLSIFNRTISF